MASEAEMYEGQSECNKLSSYRAADACTLLRIGDQV